MEVTVYQSYILVTSIQRCQSYRAHINTAHEYLPFFCVFVQLSRTHKVHKNTEFYLKNIQQLSIEVSLFHIFYSFMSSDLAKNIDFVQQKQNYIQMCMKNVFELFTAFLCVFFLFNLSILLIERTAFVSRIFFS